MDKAHRRDLFRIIAGAAVIVAVAVAVLCLKHAGILDFRQIGKMIHSTGRLAGLVFILIFVLRALLVIVPYSVMTVLGGSLFGRPWGFLLSWTGAILSAAVAFLVARHFGKSAIMRFLPKRMRDLNCTIEAHGLKIIALMRVSAVFPFDALSFTAGITQVRMRDFLIGTAVGIIPETFALNSLGHNLKHPFSKEFFVSVALVAVCILVPFIYKRFVKKPDVEEIIPAPESEEA